MVESRHGNPVVCRWIATTMANFDDLDRTVDRYCQRRLMNFAN